MKQLSLSPHRLALFKQCPRCFWREVKKGIKRPQNGFPSLPSGMDSVLKDYFDSFRIMGILPPELENLVEGKLFDQMEKLKLWRNNLKGISFFDKESGIFLRGALDDLLVTDDEFHVPVDFKTRGFPLKEDTSDNYQLQMDVYSYLLDKNGMKASDFALLVYYHPTKVEENGMVKFHVDVEKLETIKENGEKVFREAVEVLNGEEPEASEGCEWCKWGKD